MTADRFLRPGEAEALKGAVHAAVCGLAVVCGIYNAAAWLTRRERHLGVNAVLYAGLAIWEVMHVRHHGQRHSDERSVLTPPRCEGTARGTPFQHHPLAIPQWVDSPFAGASTASHAELAS
jgi:hypothetical protein